MLVERLEASPEDFRTATGWEIKPEGACKGDVCVPLPGADFDLRETADALGMAVVHDADASLWAVGPETLGGRALASTDASDFSLPDLDGRTFSLSSLAGAKVALVAWAPY